MSNIFEIRPSDSPFVESISHVQTIGDCTARIPADGSWHVYVLKLHGKTSLTVGGAITRASNIPNSAGAEWFGIRFRLGTFMPVLPARSLVDAEITLPAANSRAFYLHGSAWEFPDYENMDTFVDRLVRRGLLVHEPVVDSVLQDRHSQLSLRSVQRRFVQATGVSHRYVRQIERARYAMTLLQQGKSILDTVYEAGYFDQPHLTRSLKHLVGLTPAQLVAAESSP